MSKEKIELLMSADEYCGRLIPGIYRAVELFRGGSEKEAFKYMTNIVDGLQWLIEALAATADMLPEDIDVSGINEHLNEMTGAFENQDYILLSDLLEYEIAPAVEEWHDIIRDALRE